MGRNWRDSDGFWKFVGVACDWVSAMQKRRVGRRWTQVDADRGQLSRSVGRFVDFGDAREGADILRVDFDGGAEFAHVVGEFAYVVGENLKTLGQGLVAFGEPVKAFVGGHCRLQCSVSGMRRAKWLLRTFPRTTDPPDSTFCANEANFL